MRPLRAALTRLSYDLAEGSPPPIPIEPPRLGDIAIVNAAATIPPLVPALRPDGGTTFVAPTAPAALSTIARDAVELFGGPLARRIRVCAAENCGLLLVDTSRPGRRRWCSMELCGNRAKIRIHRSRGCPGSAQPDLRREHDAAGRFDHVPERDLIELGDQRRDRTALDLLEL